jgi:hypothetical protein
MMLADWMNPHVIQWSQYLLDSYAYWLKQELISRCGTPVEQAEYLFNSAFIVASHGTEKDPLLNYGNRAALSLWAMDWQQFIQTPSRLTAESNNREERAEVLEKVKVQGYISDYRGVRISKTGKRFLADPIVIWNIRKPDGAIIGQGATFSTWKYLDPISDGNF